MAMNATAVAPQMATSICSPSFTAARAYSPTVVLGKPEARRLSGLRE
jgi:hypothetical protein